MKNRSPMRIIELCAYVLIIIAALIWMFTGGKLYNPPSYTPPPASTQSSAQTETPPTIEVPMEEVFPT